MAWSLGERLVGSWSESGGCAGRGRSPMTMELGLTNALSHEDAQNMAKAIRDAFDEGYASYDTPAASNTLFEDMWERSDAKGIHDTLIEHSKADVVLRSP